MVRCPTPTFVGNPSPAVVGLIYPASGLIWGPRCFLIGLPDISITRNVNPAAMLIKIVRAGVITIRMSPALRVADNVVTITIPAVPIVFAGRAADFIFRLIGAADGNHLARTHARAALRRGDFGFAFPHDDFSF